MESEPGSLVSLFTFIFLAAFPALELTLGLLSILLLLACSALISGSEVAFFSLTHNDFVDLEQDGIQSSKRILSLKDKPRRLLATILISNNFINIAIVLLSDFVLRQLLSEQVILDWGVSLSRFVGRLGLQITPLQLAAASRWAITVLGVTFLLVLFGEVAPKVYAKLNNISLARLMSGPLLFLMRLFAPLSNVLVRWTNLIEKRLSGRTEATTIATKEDIDEAINLTVSLQSEAEHEVDILKRIVKFGEVSVKQIMRSRVDVVAIDFRISYPELLEIARESGYSRIPVFENDFDNVTGILYVKDLLGHLNEEPAFEWQSLIRTNVLYVPEAKKIDDLLREFQSEHLHMAIVVDEYGGSAGIVTLEDIMEEVIGDIKDEFDDEPEVEYKQLDPNNFLFEGKTLLNDVCKVLGLEMDTFDEAKGDADSLAGLLLELHGQIPKKDTTLTYGPFVFKVVSVSKRRIQQILLTLHKS